MKTLALSAVAAGALLYVAQRARAAQGQGGAAVLDYTPPNDFPGLDQLGNPYQAPAAVPDALPPAPAAEPAPTTMQTIMNTVTNIEAAVTDQVQSVVRLFTPGTMELSGDGRAALMQREGFSAQPYPDHKGYSVGYGHLIKPGESITSVTRDEAELLLTNDVKWAEAAVNQAVRVDLTQAEFDALVSFAYNVGAAAFKASTLVKRVNANDPNASDEFSRWVYASGAINSGLVARRASEAVQFDES